MRRLTIAATLLLAACGSAVEDSESNVSVAVPEPAASPASDPEAEPSPAPEPAVSTNETSEPDAPALGVIDAIPAEWRGTWAGRDGCARSATMRVRVADDRLTFYESEGVASEIERRAPREIAMKLAMSGEGEEWTRRAVLSLSEDGERLTRTEAGTDPVTYTRCAV
jgi:hypothetical protein